MSIPSPQVYNKAIFYESDMAIKEFRKLHNYTGKLAVTSIESPPGWKVEPFIVDYDNEIRQYIGEIKLHQRFIENETGDEFIVVGMNVDEGSGHLEAVNNEIVLKDADVRIYVWLPKHPSCQPKIYKEQLFRTLFTPKV